jgi:cytochrome c553
VRHTHTGFFAQLALCLFVLQASAIAQEAPVWAYPVNPPDFKLPPDDGVLRQVPGSNERFSIPQVRDRFFAPDWHPSEHPPMPTVVSVGRKPDVSACAYCHRAAGTGGPENTSLAGLPVAYIVQQIADYKTGARSTAVPKRAPQTLMILGAKAVSDDEVLAAAAYFSALKPRKTIRVVESDTAPKTFVAGWFLAKSDSSETEPIGQRIIELPDQLEQFESRDSHATFTAYVPPGSLARGQALVTGQDLGRAPACATCHGTDLHGLQAIPSIAGRSPSYVFRQLHEIKTGVRAGAGVQPMKETVAKLNHDDMIAIAAYLASLMP